VPGNQLVVLGCDGSYPGPGGAASGYLVRSASTLVWVDAGPGTFANLQRQCDPRQLDAVVLSHEHPDHWTDIESFAVWARQVGRQQPTPVYAPRGLRERSYFGKDPVLAWHVVESPSEAQIGDLRCSFVATDHGPPTNAVCFEALGPTTGSLGYSADTGPDWAIEQLGTGIGLMLCEATYTRVDEGRYRHLSGRQAGSMAATAAVSRLLLTHRWPSVSASEVLAEAAAAFGGPVVQAAIDATYEW